MLEMTKVRIWSWMVTITWIVLAWLNVVTLISIPDMSLDIEQELLPGRRDMLQFAYRCVRTEIFIQKGWINLFRTCWSPMYSYRRYLCSSYKGLLQMWAARESWSSLYWDAKVWPSPKYVLISIVITSFFVW